MSHRVQVRAKFTVTAGRRGGALIKGDLYDQPEPDLFPGFSASGQDVWVPEAHYDEPGIVVSAVGARCGKAFKADGRWTAIANTHVLLPRSGFDRDLLWWIFNDESFWIRGGSAQPYVQFEASLEQLITLPESLSAQHVIAAFLDRETSRLDTLVAAKQRLLDLLAEKRKAIIATAVTRGLDPKVKLRDSGVPWLGEIPGHWQLLKFAWCVTIAEGQVDPEDDEFSAWPLIAPNHVESGTGRLLGLESAADQGAISGKYECRPGDVIYSKIRPALRKATIAPEACLCSADMYPMRVVRERLTPEYLLHYLLTDAFSVWAVLESSRVAMPKINRESFIELRMPVPPLDEQRAIVAHIARETAQLDAVRGATERTIALLKERRAALIAAAVTGQLDMRAFS